MCIRSRIIEFQCIHQVYDGLSPCVKCYVSDVTYVKVNIFDHFTICIVYVVVGIIYCLLIVEQLEFVCIL